METKFNSMRSPRYSEYKNSGIEWVEDVPAHWEVKKFKRVFYEIKKRSNPYLNCGSISFGKVVYKDDEKIPESTKKSYQVVNKGDFLVNPLNLNYDLISLRIALSDIDVVVSSGYIVLSNSVQLDKTFYKYFLHRFDVAFMKLLGSGVRQTLNWNDIANCDLIFPPLPEQSAIAAFLDNKTTLIDQAINIKQKQIELLNERRQILIHKAVTRGLNPNIKMKDSGVEWIGKMPQDWNKTHLKWISKIYSGGTPDKTVLSFWTNGTIPWLASGEVNQEFVTRPTTYISELGFKNSSAKWIPKGSLIMALAGQGKTKGTVAYLEIDTTGNQSLAAVIPDNNIVSSLFLFYFLKAAYNELRGPSGEGQRDGLNLQVIGDFTITYPNLDEQYEILKYLNNMSEKIEDNIILLEQEIEKLKEYKATIINSAVTGKIKV
jgi:type I restriction enzyme S subunit